jgi:hypothetical protein
MLLPEIIPLRDQVVLKVVLIPEPALVSLPESRVSELRVGQRVVPEQTVHALGALLLEVECILAKTKICRGQCAVPCCREVELVSHHLVWDEAAAYENLCS